MRIWIRRISKLMFIIVVLGAIVSAPTIYRGYKLYKEAISEISLDTKVSEIRSRANYVPLSEISTDFTEGIVKSEDKRFNYHYGIDLIAITRAIIYDIKAGSFVQGGSTITQQLAKNMYFDFDKSLDRKVAEVFVAFHLEKNYTKDEILELYCNEIYYGQGCYGIKAATEHYYRTDPSQMSQNEADSLIYTIKCPEEFNPNCKEYAGSL